MKKRLYVLLIPIVFLCCGITVPEKIPTGTWKYQLKVNGTEVGNAIMTNTLEDGEYTYTTTLSMGNPVMSHTSTETIVETTDFTPVRLEKEETTRQKGREIKTSLVATFQDKTVTLKEDGHTTTIKLNEDFVLDGNYLTHALIQKNYTQGTVVETRIYEPTIELGKTIPVKAEVTGIENITGGAKRIKTLHLRQSIGKVQSIDVYIDSTGVAAKVIIQMMNMTMEITREDII